MKFSLSLQQLALLRALPVQAQSPCAASHFLSCSATKSGAFTCRTPRPIRFLISASPSQSIKEMFSKSRVSCSPSANADSAYSLNSSIHLSETRPSNCRVTSWFDQALVIFNISLSLFLVGRRSKTWVCALLVGESLHSVLNSPALPLTFSKRSSARHWT